MKKYVAFLAGCCLIAGLCIDVWFQQQRIESLERSRLAPHERWTKVCGEDNLWEKYTDTAGDVWSCGLESYSDGVKELVSYRWVELKAFRYGSIPIPKLSP